MSQLRILKGGNAMYSPKINDQHIPTLYHLGKQKKIPMTKLVNQAITEYLSKEENQLNKQH